MSVRLRGRCRLTDKLSVSSKSLHARRVGSYYLDVDAETSSVSSVFIARGYLRSNAQNRHPFHHPPLRPYSKDILVQQSQQTSPVKRRVWGISDPHIII